MTRHLWNQFWIEKFELSRGHSGRDVQPVAKQTMSSWMSLFLHLTCYICWFCLPASSRKIWLSALLSPCPKLSGFFLLYRRQPCCSYSPGLLCISIPRRAKRLSRTHVTPFTKWPPSSPSVSPFSPHWLSFPSITIPGTYMCLLVFVQMPPLRHALFHQSGISQYICTAYSMCCVDPALLVSDTTLRKIVRVLFRSPI